MIVLNRPTIGIDVDGVLAMVHQKIDEVWADAGLEISHEPDVTDFDYAKCVGKEAKALAYEVFKWTDLYDNMAPPQEAMNALRELRRRYNVVAVSAPFPEHASSKWSFCQRAGFGTGEIFLTHAKHHVKLDALVDDKVETLFDAPYLGVLFDQPWNRWCLHYPRRARSWDEIQKYLDVNLLS